MQSSVTPPVPRRATLTTGVTLPFVEQGDPLGIPLIFLHGVTDSWRSFAGVLPCLAPPIRALAITQRGHGDADRPAAGYGPHEMAADLAAFMDSVALDAAIICGHSMGSFVAQCFAMTYPARTRGLVLMGSAATLRGNAGIEEFWEGAISTLEDPIDPAFAREFQASTLAQPVPSALLDTVTQESLKAPARVWRAAFQGLLATDLAPQLASIQAPTLVVWGDGDNFFPRSEQDALVAAIPDAELLVYPGGGHAFHWEDPARFAADLSAFAQRVAAGAGHGVPDQTA